MIISQLGFNEYTILILHYTAYIQPPVDWQLTAELIVKHLRQMFQNIVIYFIINYIIIISYTFVKKK
jgi:hypothetical protein